VTSTLGIEPVATQSPHAGDNTGDAGIPARVIDELTGHQASSRGGHLRGSAIGAHYRHTTPEMAARVEVAGLNRGSLGIESE
jgi:hypothetical protein